MSPRQTVLLANSSARSHPAIPPCAPMRRARGMSGFWNRQVDLSNPKPEHTTGASHQGARRDGGVGSSKIKCQHNYSPKKQRSTVTSQASKTRRLKVPPEAKTSEFLRKPTKEQNQRLTRGRRPVHPRFIRGLSARREALFVSGCRPLERRLFVSVNPFHARHVREFMPCMKMVYRDK